MTTTEPTTTPTASALLRRCPPLRPLAEVIRDDFGGDRVAAGAHKTARYRAERAAFDAGWRAFALAAGLVDNPHLPDDHPRLAWAWADGWEKAAQWRSIAGADDNWLREGQPVRILRHDVLGSPSLAGSEGYIKKVHRSCFLGYVVVEVPPRGRRRTAREAWIRVTDRALEPVDANPPAADGVSLVAHTPIPHYRQASKGGPSWTSSRLSDPQLSLAL